VRRVGTVARPSKFSLSGLFVDTDRRKHNLGIERSRTRRRSIQVSMTAICISNVLPHSIDVPLRRGQTICGWRKTIAVATFGAIAGAIYKETRLSAGASGRNEPNFGRRYRLDDRPFMADSRRTQAAVAEMVEPQSHRRTFDEYSAYSLPNNDERMRSSGLIWNRVINTEKITGPSIAQTLRR
jgi:hypothetical protein